MDGNIKGLLRTKHSNIPDKVSDEEQGKNIVITHRLPELTLLTDAQLIDQLGEDAFKIDPVRNMLNPFGSVCFKRSALLGSSSALIFGGSWYLRTKQLPKSTIAGALAGFVAFAAGWWHCRGEVRKRRDYERSKLMNTPLPAGPIRSLPQELEAARLQAEKEGKTLELPLVATVVRPDGANSTSSSEKK